MAFMTELTHGGPTSKEASQDPLVRLHALKPTKRVDQPMDIVHAFEPYEQGGHLQPIKLNVRF